VDDAAAAFGLGPTDRHQLVVAVNEAATNAIKHGRPYPDGTIVLRIAEFEDTLVCSIADNGQFVFDGAEPAALAERGRGLKLMGLLADGARISSGAEGTIVRLHKRRPAATPEPA
jgi:anti-sigma regulatory factor (Ser/Thr protein kinase)